VHDLLTRCKLLRMHALLLGHFKSQMPVMFGKQSTQQKLIDDLPNVYRLIGSKHNIETTDFPPIELMRHKLAKLDFSMLPKVKDNDLALLDEVINVSIPSLWSSLARQSDEKLQETLKAVKDHEDPRTSKWLAITPDLADYISDFESLGPGSLGTVTGSSVKKDFSKSRLPSSVLHKIWTLADIDGDGCLDLHEYSIARHLIAMKLEGIELPRELPPHLLSRKNKK
jgi:EH domain-containing protein 1